ncbi:transglutaminase domain-containing protein [Cohnella sp.]|uniref:transglutaminase domain-containing protein n=1 Tax=Cohnella sp. TaxID=1883426 RepID=UPI00356535ED
MLKKVISTILVALFAMQMLAGISAYAEDRNTFPADIPSDDAKERIAELIARGSLPEAFQRNFRKAITVDELARLYYREERSLDRIEIDHPGFDENTPYYVKAAFFYGLIDDLGDLKLTMTRAEAAKRISKSLTYVLGRDVFTKDFASVQPEDFHAVGNVLSYGVMPAIQGNFHPNKPFTREQAILGMEAHSSGRIRGILPTAGKARVTVGSNFAYLDFDSDKDAKDYIQYQVENMTKGVKLTSGKPQRIDVGFAILELWTPTHEVKFTFKNGLENVRFRGDSVLYGSFVYTNWHGEGYMAEPRALKAGEKAVLELQPDSVHRKLYARTDEILKKILKPNMTDEQKVKAIFDYVVTRIKYSSGTDYISAANALKAIEEGKGVCVHYTSLFHYLATRAGIPSIPLSGPSFVGQHAWNMVYLNDKWVYVDATLADGKKNIDYTYYLKDAMFMMKTRTWMGFGYPDIYVYPEVDGMNLKTTEELRVYLLRKMEESGPEPPKKVTFKVANGKVDTDLKFLSVIREDYKYKLSYDSKKKLYTMTRG